MADVSLLAEAHHTLQKCHGCTLPDRQSQTPQVTGKTEFLHYRPRVSQQMTCRDTSMHGGPREEFPQELSARRRKSCASSIDDPVAVAFPRDNAPRCT